ncbi:hypothetical protein HJC23_001516 [Cyclotella cryptica]|uniref:beta-ketoacyl-[acyl-carrier-protein] synthase I n=1 Tax=Cyclotella cryptica TaxID=29204 RepID=A0ABD3P7K5_9STRA
MSSIPAKSLLQTPCRHWFCCSRSLSTFSRSESRPFRRRRVVVTGLGAITPIGADMPSTWKSVLLPSYSNDSNGLGSQVVGITSLEKALKLQNLTPDQYEKEWSMVQSLSCQVAASVPSEWITNGHEDAAPWNDGRTSRFVQLALIAAREAMIHSGLDVWLGIDKNSHLEQPSNSSIDTPRFQQRRESFGVSIGNGMSSTRDISMASNLLSAPSNNSSQLHRKISPHFVPRILPNSPSARIAIHNKLLGPNLSHSEACAAGACAIAHAVELIQCGRSTGMLAGGCESAVEALGLIGFSRLRALSQGSSHGEGTEEYRDAASSSSSSSRPFDSNRDGFVLAEGAAALVLEEHDHAVSRGANILAEVVGVGYSGDGFHITAPEPMGEGAARAMRNAIKDAALDSEDGISTSNGTQVDYINAHATSTPVGDVAEIRAIRQALSQSESLTDKPLLVSSTKGATGHLLGAAGAIEAAITVLAVSNQVAPHTRNLHVISDDIMQAITDERCPVVDDSMHLTSPERAIHLVQHEPLYEEVNLAMSNSFGFGGTNVSLLFAKV